MRASPDLSPRTFGNEDLPPRVPLPTLDETAQRRLWQLSEETTGISYP